MVGGDDDEIALAQHGLDFRHALVEGLESCGIARDVPPMAEFAVEIDEVRKDEAALGQRLHRVDRCGEAGIVAVRLDFLAGAAMSEDVADLADGDDGAARFRQPGG